MVTASRHSRLSRRRSGSVYPLQRLFIYGKQYRQQIWQAAIARAILKNPPIIILDEATSAVDNETEAAIQRSLERITVDRTTIAIPSKMVAKGIAHRLSTSRNADCIYVMEHGKFVESGTHAELLNNQAVYTNLWNVQTRYIASLYIY